MASEGDITYDYSKLRGRIVEIFGQQTAFAKALNMKVASVSMKLNGKTEWSQKDIDRVSEALRIPDEEIKAYFFTRKIQDN